MVQESPTLEARFSVPLRSLPGKHHQDNLGQLSLKGLKSHCLQVTMRSDSPSQPYPGSQEWPRSHRYGLTRLPVDIGGLFTDQKSAVLGLQAVCTDLGISIEHTPHSGRSHLQSSDKAGLVTGTLCRERREA